MTLCRQTNFQITPLRLFLMLTLWYLIKVAMPDILTILKLHLYYEILNVDKIFVWKLNTIKRK